MLEFFSPHGRCLKLPRFDENTYHTPINHAASISTQEGWKSVKTIRQTKCQDQRDSSLAVRHICKIMISCRFHICPEKDNPPESRVHWGHSANGTLPKICYHGISLANWVMKHLTRSHRKNSGPLLSFSECVTRTKCNLVWHIPTIFVRLSSEKLHTNTLKVTNHCVSYQNEHDKNNHSCNKYYNVSDPHLHHEWQWLAAISPHWQVNNNLLRFSGKQLHERLSFVFLSHFQKQWDDPVLTSPSTWDTL
jgi:hypothetical protein